MGDDKTSTSYCFPLGKTSDITLLAVYLLLSLCALLRADP